jgi:DinB family protein
MPTMELYVTLPLETRLARLSRTPGEIRAAIDGHADAPLGRRPAPASWSATEIICHLRDVEELFLTRFQTFLAMDEPKILSFGARPEDLGAWGIGDGVGNPLDPDRWAEDRQYGRSDGRLALAAFGRRRAEVLTFLGRLSPGQWQRGGIHPTRGRMTMADYAAALAGHDDNHLEQMKRALAGQA